MERKEKLSERIVALQQLVSPYGKVSFINKLSFLVPLTLKVRQQPRIRLSNLEGITSEGFQEKISATNLVLKKSSSKFVNGAALVLANGVGLRNFIATTKLEEAKKQTRE
ncbi:hypothetical protein PIB30_046551 [Stylosanthes scabra]|uniref:Uncharacterized protein n=1 Tax=Stylosanthes scabra TaxID=79078 RepID=A0ABU6UG65_9FABA|nr:hypothetical protein [Stylosanthes scabra]